MSPANSGGPVRLIALGSPHRGDDELALRVAAELSAELGDRVELLAAGRPGPGLVELLDTEAPVVLLDVVRSHSAPGTVHRIPLPQLPKHALARDQVSSHGFGPAEALRLIEALERPLPPGVFIGLEGARFELGAGPSPAAVAALAEFRASARAAILADLEQPMSKAPCTNPG